jgi:hypothetical protein
MATVNGYRESGVIRVQRHALETGTQGIGSEAFTITGTSADAWSITDSGNVTYTQSRDSWWHGPGFTGPDWVRFA